MRIYTVEKSKNYTYERWGQPLTLGEGKEERVELTNQTTSLPSVQHHLPTHPTLLSHGPPPTEVKSNPLALKAGCFLSFGVPVRSPRGGETVWRYENLAPGLKDLVKGGGEGTSLLLVGHQSGSHSEGETITIEEEEEEGEGAWRGREREEGRR